MSNGLQFVDTLLAMPMMKLPVRSVIVSIGEKRVMFSPGSKISKEQYPSLGPITDFVAPNLFHLGGVPKGASIFPEAKRWAPAGANKKRADIVWTDTLTVESWPYSSELQPHFIEGMPSVNEVVFIHRPTKSLIVSDLIFNLLEMKGLGSWLILHAFGTYNCAATSRLFLAAVKDREAFVASIKKLLQEDFQQIIPSHGEVIPKNGKEILAQALAAKGLKHTL